MNKASKQIPVRKLDAVLITTLLSCGSAGSAFAAEGQLALDELRQRTNDQARQLLELKRLLAAQEAALAALRAELDSREQAQTDLSRPRTPALVPSGASNGGATSADDAVASSAPRVAPIFEQPGVLTPKGRYTLEPSLQYSYSSSNRVALVGYTVIPAILVGLIDVREVRRSTWTGALALRYGLTNRLELEARLPYVHRSDTSIGRELLQGSTANTSAPFDVQGSGVGDAELTARYQLNDGGADRPFYITSLRLKSRTGKDPFQVKISTSIQGFRGEGVQTELPTGSGFFGVQPAVTVLYPSDPAVFFGTVSYLHSVKRSNLVQATDEGQVPIGSIAPGGIFGFNIGMGLALNEKSSFSVGYDHSSVGRTRLNGRISTDSVQLQLGTLLLGYSYRLDDNRSLNVSLGAGLTRDTPDVTLTLRIPTSF